MKYNPFIKNHQMVSEIGLGTWQLGINSGWKNMSEKEAIKMVQYAVDSGINFFDTAPNYGHGTSESRLGKALKHTDRSKIVINTKFGHSDKGNIDFNPDKIRESLEGSLRRLEVEYVDSLILHNPPSKYLDGYQNPHYEILEKLIDEGKIGAYGASLDTYEEMKVFIESTEGKIIEAFFNILHQDTAQAFDMARDKEVAIIAKIPLDSGWLTGKYSATNTFTDIRSRWSKKDIATRSRLIDKLKKIIGQDRNLAHTAISFCLSYEAVSTVIPGNTSITQLKNNIASINHTLHPEMVRKLEDFYKNEVKNYNLPW
jgi:aryl-alcohol dehydrogenase-like predicted oxidoreductase